VSVSSDPFVLLKRKHVDEATRDLRRCPDYAADIDRIMQNPEPKAVELIASPSIGESVLNDVVSYIRCFVSLSGH